MNGKQAEKLKEKLIEIKQVRELMKSNGLKISGYRIRIRPIREGQNLDFECELDCEWR